MKPTPPNSMQLPVVPRWLRRFTKLVAAFTLFLIFAGAQVTSTGSGLAVPDWPLSYGMVFPPMIGGIFYEHGHRMIAGAAGILIVAQALMLQRFSRLRLLRQLGWWSVGLVMMQALLGGLTVKLLLPPSVSVSHAALAEIVLCVNVSIAFFASSWCRDLKTFEKGAAPARLAELLVGAVYTQILLGAVMRHRGAGLAIPDFPLAFGHLVPQFTSFGIAINFAHRVGAIVIVLLGSVLGVRLSRFEPLHPLRRVAHFVALLIPAQILLGAYTIWSAKQPVITSLHVVTGATTLGATLVLALTARGVAWRVERSGGRRFVADGIAA